MEESSGGVQSMLSSQGSRSNGEAIRVGKVTVLALPLSSFPQDFLQGDCTKARQKLNWKPRVTFDVSVLPGVLCTCWVFMSSRNNSQGGERRGTPLCGVTWAPWDTPFSVPLHGSLLWRKQTLWQWWAPQCTQGLGQGCCGHGPTKPHPLLLPLQGAGGGLVILWGIPDMLPICPCTGALICLSPSCRSWWGRWWMLTWSSWGTIPMPELWLGPAGITGPMPQMQPMASTAMSHQGGQLPLPVMVLLLACLCVKDQLYSCLHPLHPPSASFPTHQPRVSTAWAKSVFCH